MNVFKEIQTMDRIYDAEKVEDNNNMNRMVNGTPLVSGDFSFYINGNVDWFGHPPLGFKSSRDFKNKGTR